MQENNQKENLVLIEDLGMMFPLPTSKYKKRYGLYLCHCGNKFKARVQDINNNHTKSCGCIVPLHNLANHKLYRIWKNMLYRCSNTTNKNYGARGIKVCDEWLSINNFINDMYPSYQEGLSIDRINVNGNYCKENCRWVLSQVQHRNTRLIKSTNTSGYRGVSWHKTANKWVVQIIVNKKIHLGLFENIIEAAKAYDKYIIINNLEHTKNF